jgi:hypothetical protein
MARANGSKKPRSTHKELSTYLNAMSMLEEFQPYMF